MTSAKSLKELLFDSGQFIVSMIFALGFLLLVYEVSQLLEKVDISKVDDPTQILMVIVTGVVGMANAVVGFYLGTKSKS